MDLLSLRLIGWKSCGLLFSSIYAGQLAPSVGAEGTNVAHGMLRREESSYGWPSGFLNLMRVQIKMGCRTHQK